MVPKPHLPSICSRWGNNFVLLNSTRAFEGAKRLLKKKMRAALPRLKSGVGKGKDRKVGKSSTSAALVQTRDQEPGEAREPLGEVAGIWAGSMAEVLIRLWLPYSPPTPISNRQPSFTLPCLRDRSQL